MRKDRHFSFFLEAGLSMLCPFVAASLAAAFVASCSTEDGEEPSPDKEMTAQAATEDKYLVSGSLIAEFSDEVTALLESGKMLPPSGVTSMERVFEDGGEWEPLHRKAGLHRWYRLGYDAEAVPATKAATGIAALPGVLYVEPERKVKSTSYFNDPYAPQQWALCNDGTLGSKYVSGADINVVPVWQNYTAGSSNVTVAVQDMGIDFSHPDLAAACIPGGVNGSRCFVYDYAGYTIYPDDHGTHVAGTIAAINNNGLGVCGVAGGSDGSGGVRILACQMMRTDPSDANKTLQGDSYNAMVWAADHGAVISQNSWGYSYETESDAASGSVGAIGAAIDYFNRYAGCDTDGNQRADSPMKGGVVIFAAGNEGWSHAWPAEYDGVIAVGAISSQMSRAYYSNFGDWVDIAAPGGDYNVGPVILSTLPNASYGGMQGTSMACPHVSGVAALIVSYFGGQGFTADMLKERLLGGANSSKLPRSYKIGPLVDALGSFTYGGTTAPGKVTDLSATASSNSLTFRWTVPADEDDGKAYGFLFLAGKDSSALAAAAPASIPAGVRSLVVLTGEAAAGDGMEAVLTGLDFDSGYYATVIAYDYAGNYADPADMVSVSTGSNNPPVITTSYTGGFSIHAHETVDAEYYYSDPDGHDCTASVETGSDALTCTVSPGVVRLRFTGRNASPGSYTAAITATDSYGASAVEEIPYAILPNHAPVVTAQPDNIIFDAVGQSATLDLAQYFSDEDGEALKYSVSQSAANIVHVNPSGSSARVTALDYGMSEVTIRAEDTVGESCSVTFKALVSDGTREVLLYPNPVTDALNIRTDREATVSVSVSDRAGAVLLSASGVRIGPFNPYTMDVSGLDGGAYYVRVSGGSIDKVSTIVKR